MANEIAETIKEEATERIDPEYILKSRYFINKDVGTVVCRLTVEYCEDEEDDLDEDSINEFYDSSTGGADEIIQSMFEDTFHESCSDTNREFVGKAICVEPDEFDIVFGKRLAYSKAKLKYLIAKRKADGQALKFIEELKTKGTDKFLKTTKNIEVAENRIKGLLKETK